MFSNVYCIYANIIWFICFHPFETITRNFFFSFSVLPCPPSFQPSSFIHSFKFFFQRKFLFFSILSTFHFLKTTIIPLNFQSKLFSEKVLCVYAHPLNISSLLSLLYFSLSLYHSILFCLYPNEVFMHHHQIILPHINPSFPTSTYLPRNLVIPLVSLSLWRSLSSLFSDYMFFHLHVSPILMKRRRSKTAPLRLCLSPKTKSCLSINGSHFDTFGARAIFNSFSLFHPFFPIFPSSFILFLSNSVKLLLKELRDV